jgi:RHS repeat-associated protein
MLLAGGALAASSFSAFPAPAMAATGGPPPLPKVAPASGVGALKPRPVPVAGWPSSVPTATTWPSAGSAVVSLAPSAAAAAPTPLTAPGAAALARLSRMTSGGPATSFPVRVETVPGGAGTAGQVRVSVLPHAAATAAGARGVLFTLAPAQGSAGTTVKAALSYAGFAQASGGNYGLGLGLAELPACALTTPAAPACQKQAPLRSTVNDPATQSVSAQVTLPKGGGQLVLAAAPTFSDGGASAGTYTATTLKPSGTWAEGGSSGSFTYSYPLPTPSAPSSLSPSLSLSYDSGSVDGQTASTQAQASWIGDGWSLSGGDSFIEQSFKTCQDQPEGSASPSATPDECYDGPVLTLAQAGLSGSLVCPVPFSYTTSSTCTDSADNGEVITHHVGAGNATGAKFTDYWTVTTRDGTTYYYGLNRLPGWASGDATTNSVDTVPVYSAHSGDPCFSASGFSSSECSMAYRWHLDYVTDAHGNALAYYYTQAGNAYAANGATSDAVAYTRDSYLSHIDYGFTAGNAYANSGNAPERVAFTTGDRCFAAASSCDPISSNASNWQDTPYTQDNCAAQGSCQVTFPTFWSTVRLKSIATEQWNGSAYVQADSWAFAQNFPPPGDGTSPALFLDSITRTGQDTAGGGASTALPAVTFNWQTPGGVATGQLANRVNAGNFPALNRFRIVSITTETGAQIGVTYETTATCSPSSLPTPSANTSSCFPVYWQQFTPATGPDWFSKYAVQSVAVSDPSGGSPGTFTSYAYSGPAWHYDDNEVVAAKFRSYGQWRGYHDVITRTGTGSDPQTESETTYYQGMSDDNNTTAVTLDDSQGGAHADANQLAGLPLETTAYLGSGGPVDHSAISSYWVSPAVATRTRAGLPDLTANVTGQVEQWSRQAITNLTTGATSWRDTETDTSYDTTTSSPNFGLPLFTDTHGDLAVASQETCAATSYAPANTAANITGLVSETQVTSGPCGGANPDGASSPGSGQLNALTAGGGATISDSRTFYDQPSLASTWPQAVSPAFPQTAAITTGDVSEVRQAVTGSAGNFTWQVKSATVYDSYGRPTSAFDGNGNKTATAYTMTNGVTTSVKVTNPLGQSTTTSYDPQRGLPLTVTDPNGITTTEQYNGLGLLTSVWEHGRATTSAASLTFGYVFGTATTPTVITTKALNDEGGYVTSTTLYDALLRPRQAQTPTPQGGILVSDDFYDSRGFEWKANTDWWDSTGTPGGTIQTVPDSQVPNQTVTSFDPLGRTIMVTSNDDNVEVRRTATAYYGNTVLTVPPPGGTPTATVTDALGRTTELDSYTSRPHVGTTMNAAGFITAVVLTGGTSQATQYQYGTNLLLSAVKDVSTGEQWTSSYNNLLGEVTGTSDPNSGASSQAYDADGNLTQVTNANGKTITYTYDALNRKTGQYDGASTSAPQIASWSYDTAGVTDSAGHLVSETSTYGGASYTVAQTGFNAFGESTGETVTIPASAGALAGTYTLGHLYTSTTGLPLRDTYPAAPAPANGTTPLPAETVTHGYETGFDLPASLSGLAAYVQNVTYSDLSQVQQEEIGSISNNAFITNTYDPNTGNLTDSAVQNTTADPSAAYDDTYYAYDGAGNVTAQTDTRNGSQVETQCFGYDNLDRLTAAWTTATSAGNNTSSQPNTAACATTPTAANASTTVSDGIGGSAYWTSWAYNALGDRTSQDQHSLTGGNDTVTSYAYGQGTSGATQPDTLASATTKSGATTTATAGYAPDKDGNTTTLNGQALAWADNGKLATDTTSKGKTSYAYDADGNLLLATDPTSATLYLYGGAQQVKLTTSGTGQGAISGTRVLDLPGGGQAVRTGTAAPGTSTTPGTTTSSYSFQTADQHGTATLTLSSAAASPTWRQFDPFGNPRGATPGAWPDPSNTFLGKPQDTNTGLDIIGARNYDSTTGRFISIDPVFEQDSPQQLNGYTYAGDNPITNSDPTGLHLCGDSCSGPTTGVVGSGWICGCGGSNPSTPPPTSGGGSGGGGTLAGSCPDYEPGCPGFTGGGAPQTGEPLVSPTILPPFCFLVVGCEASQPHLPPQATPTRAKQGPPQQQQPTNNTHPATGWNPIGWFTHTAVPNIVRHVIHPIGRALQVAYHWTIAYRGTLATLGAILGCILATVGVCAVGIGVALGFRVDQRIQAFGFRASLRANVTDVIATGFFAIPAAGATGIATEGVAADGVSSSASLGLAATNIVKGVAIIPDIAQFVGGFLPGHDQTFFIGNTLGSN